jgi:hypothetical protein
VVVGVGGGADIALGVVAGGSAMVEGICGLN